MTGAGNRSLGDAMVGGLVVSQTLTVFTTPVVYLYLDRFSNALSRWMERKPEVEVESERQTDAAE